MKLLLYSHAFAPSIGGVQTIVGAFARGLARGGVEVTVATPAPRGEMDDAHLPFAVVRSPSARDLVRLIRQADLVHLAGPALMPLTLGLLLGRPVVVEHHGFQTICPNGQLYHEPTDSGCPGHFMAGRHRECLRCNRGQGRIANLKLWSLTFVRRWLCRRVAANIAPTAWLGEVLGLPRTTTILHGLNGTVPLRASRHELPLRFAFVGRLVGTKGVRVLLDAAMKLRAERHSFRVDVIGDGPDRAEFEAIATGSGLEQAVCFRGRLSSEAMERVLQESDALVMPSLAGEVFGLAALENMFRGGLVIASRIGSLAEVVGDAGLTFEPGNAEALAACMRRVIENPRLAEELGRRSGERAQSFFREAQMIDKHIALYEKVLALGNHSPGRSAEVPRRVRGAGGNRQA